MKRVASSLVDSSLCVIPADKEGGFAVLPAEDFNAKALEAISATFNCHREVSLAKVKAVAKRMCNRLNLQKLTKAFENSKQDHLQVFFSAKTHKPGVPLRVIVSEIDTWQKPLGVFLQQKLGLLPVSDPFLVKSSDTVIDF